MGDRKIRSSLLEGRQTSDRSSSIQLDNWKMLPYSRIEGLKNWGRKDKQGTEIEFSNNFIVWLFWSEHRLHPDSVVIKNKAREKEIQASELSSSLLDHLLPILMLFLTLYQNLALISKPLKIDCNCEVPEESSVFGFHCVSSEVWKFEIEGYEKKEPREHGICGEFETGKK